MGGRLQTPAARRPPPYAARVGRRARHGGGAGAIAAGHPVTAAVGARVLGDGGNACDALIAAAVASWAAEPAVTGPGGGGFVLYRPAGGRPVLLDCFVAAPGLGPARASRPMDVIDVEFGSAVQRFRVGVASCGVPGAPAGLAEAHRRWSSWPWADLLAPAVGLARDGVELTEAHHALHVILEGVLHASPAGRAIFAAEGGDGGPAAVVRQPDLADTLERLVEAGAGDLYDGALARRLARFFRAEGGALSGEDLAAYRVVARRPVETTYRGHAVVTNAPPSTGGLLLAYALTVADDLAPLGDPLGPEAVRMTAAVLAEAEGRRAPDLVRRLDRGGARSLLDPAAVADGRRRVLDALEAGPLASRAPVAARGTTHISVLDAAGNAAAMTASTGTGSGVFVGDTGIHMNNILGEEDLVGEGTRVRPGHRLTSMMAPTHLRGRDGFEAVLGSSGSARIRSALFRVISALVDHRLPVLDAVVLPRVHPTATALDLEGGTPAATVATLRQAGEEVLAWPDRNIYFGGAQVAGRRDGRLEAAGDPRRGGAGLVVEP